MGERWVGGVRGAGTWPEFSFLTAGSEQRL